MPYSYSIFVCKDYKRVFIDRYFFILLFIISDSGRVRVFFYDEKKFNTYIPTGTFCINGFVVKMHYAFPSCTRH